MYHDSIVLYILKYPAHPPGVSKDKNSKHYLFLRLEQYFPHHTILHRKLCLQSCTHFLQWSLYCILFLSFKKNTHNRFSFLPILATAIPSCKMFKLCSLFSFFMPFKRIKRLSRHIYLSLHQERLKSSISCQKRQSVFKPIAPSDVVTLSYSVCICRNASSKCAKTLSLSARCSFVNDGS